MQLNGKVVTFIGGRHEKEGVGKLLRNLEIHYFTCNYIILFCKYLL